jgi:hypothetical protein
MTGLEPMSRKEALHPACILAVAKIYPLLFKGLSSHKLPYAC